MAPSTDGDIRVWEQKPVAKLAPRGGREGSVEVEGLLRYWPSFQISVRRSRRGMGECRYLSVLLRRVAATVHFFHVDQPNAL